MTVLDIERIDQKKKYKKRKKDIKMSYINYIS